MATTPVKHLLVFASESPSALDSLADRTESQTLQAVCKLLGHKFASTLVRSKAEFAIALNHVTSINEELIPMKQRGRPLCLHIAAHGDKTGLAFGADSVDWQALGETLWNFFLEMEDYSGPIIMIVSACKAEHQKITDYFTKRMKKEPTLKPAEYVLTTVGNDAGEVYWQDSVVAWSIFYHQIGAAVLDNRGHIQQILDKIKLVGAGSLKYFRWDANLKKYKGFASKKTVHTRRKGKA